MSNNRGNQCHWQQYHNWDAPEVYAGGIWQLASALAAICLIFACLF